MAKKRITLGDIAKELKVSVGLVSLVLSGKAKENRIGEEMTKKVIAKAAEMGYRANVMARGLRTGKSGIIGIAVADIANPYFGKMARYIENEASKLGYQVMFGSSDEDADKLNSILNVFQSRQVDAMIVVPVENSESCLKNINEHVPTVFIDRECEGLGEDVVCTDNFSGAVQLNNVLLKEGYRKIAAFVYNLKLSNNNERIRGYVESLNAHDKNSSPIVFEIDFQNVQKELKKALDKAIDMGCDALFFANNSLGIQSLKILRSIDELLASELGMVSFDNPEAFQISNPTITCFEQPIEEMCKKAVSVVSAKINENEDLAPVRTLLPGKLIIRDSQ